MYFEAHVSKRYKRPQMNFAQRWRQDEKKRDPATHNTLKSSALFIASHLVLPWKGAIAEASPSRRHLGSVDLVSLSSSGVGSHGQRLEACTLHMGKSTRRSWHHGTTRPYEWMCVHAHERGPVLGFLGDLGGTAVIQPNSGIIIYRTFKAGR